VTWVVTGQPESPQLGRYLTAVFGLVGLGALLYTNQDRR
jgi:hypothetical protein